MKICFFTGEFTTPKTGGEIYNTALLEAATKAGLENQIHELYHFNNGNKTNLFLMNLFVIKQIWKLPVDTIVMYDMAFLPAFFLGISYSKFRKNIQVGMLHHFGYWDSTKKRGKIVHRIAANFLSSKLDYLLTNSEFSKQSFYKHTKNVIPTYIVNPFINNRMQPIFSKHRFESSMINFLHVGTIQRRKNIHTTINALSRLQCDFAYDIVGKWESDQYKEELYSLVKSLGLSNKVHFHGRLNDEELATKYENATIFIMVSNMEGYGMVYTDAMKYGLPIIASNRGAIPEVVTSGVNGILCDPNDDASIFDAINKMVSDSDILNRMSMENYKKYQTFISREEFIDRYYNYFSEIKNYVNHRN